MKKISRLLSLLLTLAAILALAVGCGVSPQGDAASGNGDTSTGQQESEGSDAPEGSGTENGEAGQDADSEDGSSDPSAGAEDTGSGQEAGGEADTDWDYESDPNGFTSGDSSTEGMVVGTTTDLQLTQVDEQVSTIVYQTVDGDEVTMPVSNTAHWDGAMISGDLTSVDVSNESRTLTMSYYTVYTADYDLESAVDFNESMYAADGGELEQTGAISSSDGKVRAQALYGTYAGLDICQILITSDYGDELAVLELSLSGELAEAVPDAQALLDYLGVGAVMPDGL